MAKGALLVGWGPLIPGREKAGQNVLGDAMQYCTRLQREGVLDSFEAVVLEPHGSSDLGGFVLIKGDKDALARLRVEDEFVRTIVGVQLVH
jgi:sirohydrochlorin ferrochelatase